MTTVSLQSPELCRVRAITAFATLSSDAQTWPSVLAEAKRQCDQLAAAFQQGGYTVQSVRIVANPFGEYLDTSSLEAASQGLATIRDILMQLNQNGLRIRFAVGEARTAAEIAREINADACVFQDLAGLEAIIRKLNPNIDGLDSSCFNGEYITGDIDEAYLKRLSSHKRQPENHPQPTHIDYNVSVDNSEE